LKILQHPARRLDCAKSLFGSGRDARGHRWAQARDVAIGASSP